MSTSDTVCEACENLTAHFDAMHEERALATVPEWDYYPDGMHKIGRTFRFADFREAMVFVNRVADLAERNGHHPDLHISYNQVQVVLYTHAVKGLSENDFVLARLIDALP